MSDRTQQLDTRRWRYYRSRLSRHRLELVELRRAGASYRDLVAWLADQGVRVAPSTVQRYLTQLREVTDGA